MRAWMILFALPLFFGCPGKSDDTGNVLPTEDRDGDGFTTSQGDCDDTDAQVNPGMVEVYYTGIDEDCDPTTVDTDQDGDGALVGDDCVDTDPTVYPGAEELCDGIDNDCSGVADDGVGGKNTGWTDADLDGYGDAAAPVTYCGELPAGVADNADDCNDADAAFHPGAKELCTDTEDYNCDGSLGQEDRDGDGFSACSECDDGDATVNPDALEVCNGKDDDCNGDTDGDAIDQLTWYADLDADGYGDDTTATLSCTAPKAYIVVGGDCDDTDPTVNPGVDEACTDTVDRNCDGSVGAVDVDGDGVLACDDCDDGDPAIYPGATEVCDTVDNDCNGAVDDGAADATPWYADTDGDSYGDPTSSVQECSPPAGFVADAQDCDDANVLVNPGAAELCDTLDNDCDGAIDDDPVDGFTVYTDGDGDGFGDDATATASCDASGITVGGDCDDADATSFPGATEVCDAADNDCNGLVDDGATGGDAYYPDGDGDGYGDAAGVVYSCTALKGYLTVADDCDDTDAAVNPAGVEACNGYDDDCDGGVDEAGAVGEVSWYADADGDGYGDPSVSLLQCDAPAGYSADDSDCDDGDAAVFPGAVDDYDAEDTDCDGWVDEDSVSVGDLVFTEVARQPRFGGVSTVSDGMWFEIYNTSANDVDMSNWYIMRSNRTVGTDAFFVDPSSGVIVPAGGYAVFCKTDNYISDPDASVPLVCDYYWGDEAYSGSYSGTYHNNTFNPQRDQDRLALFVGGGSGTGTNIDQVIWYYDVVNGYWPRDATRALVLDPDFYDGVDNDDIANWCSAPTTADTWWEEGTAFEYGTPGGANYDCY